jgi:ribosome-binding protein aMBF1 (putative translation factor)
MSLHPNPPRTVWTTRREALGMTQEELSIGSLVGITRLKAIEAGRTEPTPAEHFNLERVLSKQQPGR